ncbi:hypothetical protein BH11GEM1_BH11GEM1_34810 [soil metagenome]
MFALSILRRTSAVGVVAMGALAACSSSDSMTNSRSSMSLSFAAQGASSSSASVSASSIPVTNGGHSLDLTAVTLGITKVELHSVAKGEMENEGCDDGHGCGKMVATPVEVTLSATGGVVTAGTSLVPPGTYKEIGVKVGTVRLVGTYDSKAFDVTLPVNVEREMEFKPPVTVGGASDPQRNVTIAVPLSTWLTNSDGTLVDPSRLATDASLRAAVAQRIRASLRAFRDDNKNNRDDDNDEH